jgi:di/tricarboxylate transporter
MESLTLPAADPGRAVLATLILAAAILAGATGWLDTATAFLAGGVLTLALRVLPADLAGSYVNIRFLLMIAAMSSLGTAMEQSGAARFLADGVVACLGPAQPLLLLAAFFLLTVLLTQPLSNAAAALLVLPIGIHAAGSIGVDPRSFAIAITIGASCSFITPFEPACLLVYSTGRYRFMDSIISSNMILAIDV